MLGHQLFKHLASRYTVCVTLRQPSGAYQKYQLFNQKNSFFEINALDIDCLMKVFAEFKPQAVVNGIGIIKQRKAASESITSLEINSLFPHRLALLCKATGSRMIHLSTDCVFSGKKGNYKESDPPDAGDLYGMTKFLGEVDDGHCLTLRTSIIGRELSRKKSLLEWFLAQSKTVNGFKNAVFSGFTTIEMSRIIEKMIINHPEASGIYNVSSNPISKYDLLSLIREKMNFKIKIIPDETFRCDRSLDSTRFCTEFNYTPPAWEEMIKELYNNLTF